MTGDINTPRTSSEQDRPGNLNVCVAYDGSVHAQGAVRWAAAEAARRGRPLRVVHVVDLTGLVMGAMAAPPVDGWPRPLLEAGQATADEGVDTATWTAPSVIAEAVVLTGSPATSLVEESRRADLLVLGTRERGEFSAACLGSVSTAVAAHAFCPVVIVRMGTPPIPGPGFPVVVGVDGSESAAGALEVAADVAAQAHAQLLVVSVWTGRPQDIRRVNGGGVPSSRHHVADGTRNGAERVAEQAADTARKTHRGLDVIQLVVRGRPAQELGHAANGGGVLVVGSRGRGAFTGLMLGSVSHGAVHTAPCPVMVVGMPKASRRHEDDKASMHVLI